jgi:hypothetical protein
MGCRVSIVDLRVDTVEFNEPAQAIDPNSQASREAAEEKEARLLDWNSRIINDLHNQLTKKNAIINDPNKPTARTCEQCPSPTCVYPTPYG